MKKIKIIFVLSKFFLVTKADIIAQNISLFTLKFKKIQKKLFLIYLVKCAFWRYENN